MRVVLADGSSGVDDNDYNKNQKEGKEKSKGNVMGNGKGKGNKKNDWLLAQLIIKSFLIPNLFRNLILVFSPFFEGRIQRGVDLYVIVIFTQ